MIAPLTANPVSARFRELAGREHENLFLIHAPFGFLS
jgi:hypothetical protein